MLYGMGFELQSVEAFDEQVQTHLGDSQTVLRREMLKNVRWTPEHAPVGPPGYFMRLPAGSRCCWSCNWQTRLGVWRPSYGGWPVESMTAAELFAEGVDVIARSTPEQLPIMLERFAGQLGNPDMNHAYWAGVLRDVLQSFRESAAYGEYTAPWNPAKELLRYARVRPGWNYSARDVSAGYYRWEGTQS